MACYEISRIVLIPEFASDAGPASRIGDVKLDPDTYPTPAAITRWDRNSVNCGHSLFARLDPITEVATPVNNC